MRRVLKVHRIHLLCMWHENLTMSPPHRFRSISKVEKLICTWLTEMLTVPSSQFISAGIYLAFVDFALEICIRYHFRKSFLNRLTNFKLVHCLACIVQFPAVKQSMIVTIWVVLLEVSSRIASSKGCKLEESDMLFVLSKATGSTKVERRALILLYTVCSENKATCWS